MRKDLISLSFMFLLLVGSFAPFVTAKFANPTTSWQASNPTLDGYYSGSIDTYWPILSNLEDDNCNAFNSNTDFIVAIPPNGCRPSVVRSDLLAEQNVPVFCQLSAIKVNPLIDVSTIKSISFKGDYPDEVAGISFHPARAAISSTMTLSGDPIEQNIGYVVIVLKRMPNERDLAESFERWEVVLDKRAIKDGKLTAINVSSRDKITINERPSSNLISYKDYGFRLVSKLGYNSSDEMEEVLLKDLQQSNIIKDRQGNYYEVTKSKKSSTEEYISGMLTATISYDAKTAFGTGAGSYYLEEMLDYEWDERAEDFSFWGGKGYLRATSIDDGRAVIEVMNNKNDVIDTVDLVEGNLSEQIYYPGQYCTASIQLKLNSIDSGSDSARLNIDGDNIWVRRGTRLFDGKCVVSDVNVKNDGSGSVTISCSGQKSFTLYLEKYTDEETAAIKEDLKNKEAAGVMGGVVAEDVNCNKDDLKFTYGLGQWEFEAIDPTRLSSNKVCEENDCEENDNTEGIAWYYTKSGDKWYWHNPSSSGDTKDGEVNSGTEGNGYNTFISLANKAIAAYSCLNSEETSVLSSKIANPDIKKYFDLSTETTLELVDNYPYEVKKTGEYWAEESLFEQIELAEEIKDFSSQLELIDLFLSKYPESSSFDYLKNKAVDLVEWDYKAASKTVALNNGNYNIRLEGLSLAGNDEDLVNVRIGGGRLISLKRNKIYDAKTWEEIKENEKNIFPRMEVSSIGTSGARFVYYWEDEDKIVQSKTFSIVNTESYSVNGVEIMVVDTQIRKVASVSLIPNIKNNKAEANFTFNIGVEKRAIELNPDKVQKQIESLNKTIAKWQETVDFLGDLVSGMKTACMGVSGYLALKSMVSGFDGSSIARSQVMDYYENEVCKNADSLSKCYSQNADEIESDVKKYSEFISEVNNKVKCANKETTVDSGLFGGKVINSSGYVDELSRCAEVDSNFHYEGITKDLLTDASDYQAVLLKQYACDGNNEDVVCKIATGKMKSALADNVDRLKVSALESKLNIDEGAVYADTGGKNVQVSVASKEISVGGATIEKGVYYKVIVSGNDELVYKLNKRDVSGTFQVIEIYRDGRKIEDTEATNELYDELANKYTFINNAEDGSSCENKIDSPYVRYYESANVQGFAGIVPFDLYDGWYAYVDEEDYTESGEATAFWICNVGRDNKINDGPNGGDVCSRFSINVGSNVLFTPCPDKSSDEVKKLYSKAQAAIREANIDGEGVSLNGERVPKAAPLGVKSDGLECTDFMSVDDCNLMFNVCDPVMCPTSRCDMGGKYPVSNVVSSGIVGSIALCLPNFGTPDEGGVLVPVCLTGVNEGLKAYLSVLKSYQNCLEKNVETGEYTGVCDEINAIYVCDFFWGQISPLVENFLPTLLSGENQMRGGAEYLTTQAAFDNLEKSIDYFTGEYAENTFRSFSVGNTEEIGTSICKNFVGASVPTTADLLEGLSKSDSPSQFYAQFSESVFSQATVPSTSHYKVYYHIYAGDSQGAQYRVYLKNPPESSYYANRQTVEVDSGYIGKGGQADEAKDFTAPSGYKELCVSINGIDECGFESVTSDFGFDVASQLYVEEQASLNGITTTKDCVSTVAGNPSFNLNAQTALEKSFGGEDIATTGITRICASANPSKGVLAGNVVYCTSDSTCDSGYKCDKAGDVSGDFGICKNDVGENQISMGNWRDVGYCDNENVRCWLDMSSVKKVVGDYVASGGDATTTGMIGYDFNEEYEYVEAGLNSIREEIGKLVKSDLLKGSLEEPVYSIVLELDYIIGTDNEIGEGLNVHKARALAMKASVYRMITRAIAVENPEIEVSNANILTENEVEKVVVAEEADDINREEADKEEVNGEVFKIENGAIYYGNKKTDYVVYSRNPNVMYISNSKSERVSDVSRGSTVIDIMGEFENAVIENAVTLKELEEYYYDFDEKQLKLKSEMKNIEENEENKEKEVVDVNEDVVEEESENPDNSVDVLDVPEIETEVIDKDTQPTEPIENEDLTEGPGITEEDKQVNREYLISYIFLSQNKDNLIAKVGHDCDFVKIELKKKKRFIFIDWLARDDIIREITIPASEEVFHTTINEFEIDGVDIAVDGEFYIKAYCLDSEEKEKKGIVDESDSIKVLSLSELGFGGFGNNLDEVRKDCKAACSSESKGGYCDYLQEIMFGEGKCLNGDDEIVECSECEGTDRCENYVSLSCDIAARNIDDLGIELCPEIKCFEGALEGADGFGGGGRS